MHRLFQRLLLALALLALTLPVSAARSNDDEMPPGYARLLVITNFENTEVSINHVSYPYEYIYDERRGILMPANMPFQLKVAVAPEKTRHFRLSLREGETRVIVVDVENMGTVTPPPAEAPSTRPAAASEDSAEEEEATIGYLGVSSSPRGTVVINESNTGQKTPARRIELEPGRHRIQVIYDETGETSETKYVLIRAGTNTNVFFRQRRATTGN